MTDYLAAALASVDERLAKARAIREAKPKHRHQPLSVKRTRSISDAEIATIRLLAAQGLSSSAIGAQIHRAGDTVRGICAQHGIKLKPILRSFDHDEAARLYLAGSRLSEISAQLGVTPAAVDNALARLGVQRRPRGDTWFVRSNRRAETREAAE